MSLEQQIEEAWESYCKESGLRAGMHPEMREDFLKGCRLGIEIGRREALRKLYVEVKPEDVKHEQIYYASWPGQPIREVYCGDEYFSYWEQGGIGPNGEIEHVERSVNPDICKVYELNLPSPSAVFGGGA